MLKRADEFAIEARASGELAPLEKAITEALRARERLQSNGSASVRAEVDGRLAILSDERARRQDALDVARKDRQVVSDLDEARFLEAEVDFNSLDLGFRKDGTKPAIHLSFDIGMKHMAYLVAFRTYGIDVGALPVEEAARRIQTSRVAAHLIAALDDWGLSRSANVPNDLLAAIARAADNDLGHAAIRDAIARRDEALASDLIKREGSLRELGPRYRVLFTTLLMLNPTAHIPFLESIRREHPSDFWLNFGLAGACSKAKRTADSVSYYRAAVALRPESPGVRFNHAVNFLASRDYDNAIAEFRDAIRFKSDYFEAITGLGDALSARGRSSRGDRRVPRGYADQTRFCRSSL